MAFDAEPKVPAIPVSVPTHNPHGYNLELFAKVADAIEAEEIARFNMNYIGRQTECGTVACISGFAGLLIAGDPLYEPEEELGISWGIESETLFYGCAKFDICDITRSHALRVIRNGILKGEKIDAGIWQRHAEEV